MIPITPGTILGNRYRLTDARASGASATIWMARDETLDRRVAVKILHSRLAQDPSVARQFGAEALAAATVNHPGLVAVYDTLDDPVPAIVLEWIDGPDLRRRLDSGPMSIPELVTFGVSLADALDAIHRAGLVHRDVKPANIMFTDSGQVKLTDFGIATAGPDDTTSSGVVLGTAKYLSPEQVRGHTIDGRTDVYAMCVVLFEALTGRPPFSRDTDIGTALARIEADPPDPRLLRPDAPSSLVETIMIGLRVDPSRRWQTAADLGNALKASLPPVRPETPVERVSTRARRPWWPRLVGFAVAASVAVLGIYLIASGGQLLTG